MAEANTLHYDHRSFIINGERQLLIMGEIHYARVPLDEWHEVFEASIACGINSVASYVFWNIHEPVRDEFDFGLLTDWLQYCQHHRMKVLLRCGPYCCGEWSYGGFPAWLRDEPGIVIRTFNKPYLARVERYFEELAAAIVPYLATNGGPVIMVQLENEYNNVAKRYGEAGEKYLQWMRELADRLELAVPKLMCEGGVEGVVEGLNGFSFPAERVDEFCRRRPDLPLIVTEFWTGWYNTWGRQQHKRDYRHIILELLRFVSRGGAGWNYYMWHGGTNLGGTGMYLQATSYDFDAPLDEHVRVTEKAVMLTAVHKVLTACAELLLEGDRSQSLDGQIERTIWTLAERSLAFEFEDGHVRILRDGNAVLYDTRHAWSVEVQLPEWKQLVLTKPWKVHPEPMPAERRDNPIIAREPIEQLLLTRENSDYCWYCTTFEVETDGLHELTIPFGGDYLQIFVDGELMATDQPPFLENRGPTHARSKEAIEQVNPLETTLGGFHHEFQLRLDRGQHELAILCCSLGLIKGDWMISGPMNEERKGIWSTPLLDGRELYGWRHYPELDISPDEAPELATAGDRQGRPLAWLCTQFNLTSKQLGKYADFRLDARELGKGLIFLNGALLGRHWLIEGDGYGPDEGWQEPEVHGLSLGPNGEPTQRYYRIPRYWLQKRNELVVFEETAQWGQRIAVMGRVWEKDRTRVVPVSAVELSRGDALSITFIGPGSEGAETVLLHIEYAGSGDMEVMDTVVASGDLITTAPQEMLYYVVLDGDGDVSVLTESRIKLTLDVNGLGSNDLKQLRRVMRLMAAADVDIGLPQS